MTLVACPALYLPDPNYFTAGIVPTATSTLLDAAADRVAAVFKAPKTGNILKLEVRFGTVPVLTTSDLTIGLQDVDLTNGNPDGTFDQSVTIATASITANTTFKATLGAARAVTRGDRLAIVVQFNTFIALDNLNIIGSIAQATRGGPFRYGYSVVNVTGAYAKSIPNIAAFSVEYDDGTYAFIPDLFPAMGAGTTLSINNTTTPDEIGLRFQVPFACKLGGCHAGLNTGGDANIVLYTAAGRTVVATLDKDVQSSASEQVSPIMFTAEQTLAANTTYILAVEPSSASNVTLAYYDVSSNAVLGQTAQGIEHYYATAKNPSTTADFALTTTRRPTIGLIITAVDDGTGPGVSSTAPMLAGLVVA